MTESFAPRWTKGMEWWVEMATTYQDVEVAVVPRDNGLRQMTSVWQFTVQEISGIESVIRMHGQDGGPSPGYYLLYFRPEPLSLSRVVAEGDNRCRILLTAQADSFYSYGDIFEKILDFPSFPRLLADDERDFFTSDGARIHERVVLIGDRDLVFDWSVELGLEIRNATQTWEWGKPWWSVAKRSSTPKVALGGEPEPWEYASGRLIRF